MKYLLICTSVMLLCCCRPQQIDVIRYVEHRDTIIVHDTIIDQSMIDLLKHNYFIVDSTNKVLKEELFVANYKLERIKYYNNIAGKQNNIVFLRGWINRVLNDK